MKRILIDTNIFIHAGKNVDDDYMMKANCLAALNCIELILAKKDNSISLAANKKLLNEWIKHMDLGIYSLDTRRLFSAFITYAYRYPRLNTDSVENQLVEVLNNKIQIDKHRAEILKDIFILSIIHKGVDIILSNDFKQRGYIKMYLEYFDLNHFSNVFWVMPMNRKDKKQNVKYDLCAHDSALKNIPQYLRLINKHK